MKKTNKEIKDQILSWLQDYKFANMSNLFFKDEKDVLGQDIVRLYLFTKDNQYTITSDGDYLSSSMTNRRTCLFETHCRGMDLPDGDFNVDTWNRIIGSIVMCELVDE